MLRRVAVVVWASALAALFVASLALAAEPTPVPDSACASEKTFKSTSGATTAQLTIINNTSATLQSLWLDYDGKRVFYERIPPLSRYTQPTWLTHPWIVASLEGTCYRLVVMTSVQQVVTVNPGGSGSVATPPAIATLPPVATAPPIATLPPVPTLTPISGGPSGNGSGGFPVLPVVGGLAGIVALIAILAATGHLPGMSGAGSGAGSGSSSAAIAMTPGLPPGTDLASLGLDTDAIRQLVEDNLGDVTGNLVSGIQSTLQQLLPAVTEPPFGGTAGTGGSGSGTPSLRPGLPPGTNLAHLGFDADAVIQVIKDGLGSVTVNIVSGLENSLQQLLPAVTEPPFGATGPSGSGAATPSLHPSLPLGTNLAHLGFDAEAVIQVIQDGLGSITTNLASGLESSLQQLLPAVTETPFGGIGTAGSGSGMPSLGPSLPPGTDLASLGFDADTIRQLVQDNMGAATTNIVSGIESTLQQFLPSTGAP